MRIDAVPNQNPHYLTTNVVTSEQVELLLRTLMTMANAIAVVTHSSEDDKTPEGGAIQALEASMIQVCNRLDLITANDDRWSLQSQKESEQRLATAQNAQIDFMRAQTATAKELGTPHFRYRPTIQRLEDGTGWTAFLGDPEANPGSVIAGIGRSPEEALLNFDEIFRGHVPPHMVEWLIAHEQAVTNNTKSPPMPEAPKQNEKTQLDGAGSSNVKGPSRKRTKR